MKVRFFRRRFIEADIPQGAPRAFEVALGLEAPVNPLSGMTVNLSHVDEWLATLQARRSFADEWACIEAFRQHLDKLITAAGAKLVRLELKEDRKWWAHDERGLEFGQREASRKMAEDGRSTPIWLETVKRPDGALIETREIAYDGLVTHSTIL